MRVVARHKIAPLVALDDGSVIDTEDLEVIGNGAVQGSGWEMNPDIEMDPRWEEIARADASNLGVTETKVPKGPRSFRAPSHVRDALSQAGVETPLADGQGLTLDELGALSEHDQVTGPAEEWMFGVLNKHEQDPDEEEQQALFDAAHPELDYDEIDSAADEDGTGPVLAAIEPPPGDFAKVVYLALIQEDDTKSVQDLVALVSSKTGAAQAFTYESKGWKEAPDVLIKLQSPAPPPIKQLEDWQTESVIQQISATNNFDKNDHPETASEPASADNGSPDSVDDENTEAPVQASAFELDESSILWGPDNKQILAIVAARHSAGNWTGNAQRLRDYWQTGKGGAKIRWNTPGDWTRCRRHLSKYLGVRANGYCQLMHKRMTGVYTGSRFNIGGNGR